MVYKHQWKSDMNNSDVMRDKTQKLGIVCYHTHTHTHTHTHIHTHYIYIYIPLNSIVYSVSCWSSHCGSAVMNAKTIHENVGSIPGPTQWVKDPVLP